MFWSEGISSSPPHPNLEKVMLLPGNIRLFLCMKHFLFWANLIWMLWLFQTFIWKATVCSVWHISMMRQSSVTVNTKEQNHHEIESGFLMTFPVWDMASNICLFTDTMILVFSVASWEDAWLYCEQAEGSKVVLWNDFCMSQTISSSQHGQRSWAIILFSEFLQLPNESSLNCWWLLNYCMFLRGLLTVMLGYLALVQDFI